MKQYLQMIHPKPLTGLVSYLQGMIQGRLWLKIIVAMIAGLVTGNILSPQTGLVSRDTAEVIGSWLAIPGNIFLGLIQMIVVPLIFASVIRGLASSEDLDQLKKIGIRLVFYFLITTSITIIIGLSVTTIIKPGDYIDSGYAEAQVDIDELTPGDEETPETPDATGLPETFVSLIARHNPLHFLSAVREVQLLAFSTSSSAAVMPLSMQTAEDKLGVRPSISQFLIPLGASINMDGTALYQAAATVFLAQVYNVELGLPSLLLILVTTVGASDVACDELQN